MAYEVKKIAPLQTIRLLASKEGQYLDFKAIEVAPGKLTKHLSAFANSDGGEMFIGFDDEKENGFVWRGFAREEDANGHVQALENFFPLGQDFTYDFVESTEQQGLLLHITVRKTKDVRLSTEGKAYIRRNAQSMPVAGDGLRRLELDKGVVSFENERVNVPLSAIVESDVIRSFVSDIIPHAEPAVWLSKQMLVDEGKPTVAGCLLFSDEPQAYLPKRSGIKVYRYKSTAKEGSRETMAFHPLTIEGHLYEQISKAVTNVVSIIEDLSVLSAGAFAKVSYPRETLHEIITNALLHRDYSIPDDVHIRIFDNRVEVESPGTLPGHVNSGNILNERFARNPTIVRLINKFPNPPNMDVGEGLNTAFEAMKSLRLKEPQIIEREASVLVNIRHEPLGSPEEIIVRFLTEHPTINNSRAREICHIGSENTVKRIFERLKKQGQIENVPGLRGRRTEYRKKLARLEVPEPT